MVLEGSGLHIGIDVGGTNIKAGLAGSDGCLSSRVSVRTAASQEEIVAQLCELVHGLLKACPEGSAVRGIGVAVPGDVDVENGIAVAATNLPWDNLPVTATLSGRFGLPTRLENDTDAGVLGEALFGKARGMKHVVYIALGTGVGGGLVLGGELFRGTGGAGEIGHMIALSDGPMCKCGTRGCLEAVASATAIVTAASEGRDTPFGNTAQVFAAAAAGDARAQYAIGIAGRALASTIISLRRLLAPEVIILGGGVSKAGQQLLDAVQAGLDSFADGWQGSPIVLSDSPNWSGVLGAAAAAATNWR